MTATWNDLIAGWLEKDAELARLKAELAALKGNGDDLDVEAGRCCPHCRTMLTDHNRAVWNAGYSVGRRHAGDPL